MRSIFDCLTLRYLLAKRYRAWLPASTTMKTGVLGTGTPTNKERLLAAYAAYNRQDGAALLALVSEDVDWPDGSARLHGKAELRAYWTRQWAMTRTHDEPVEITDLSPDRSVVRIRQVVRTLDGTKIPEASFDHPYRFQGGLIERMDIQNLEALPR